MRRTPTDVARDPPYSAAKHRRIVMQHSILFPQYALAVWTLCTPLIVGVVEWFITRREHSELTRPQGRPGYIASPR